jgi:hypothetical protein
MRKLLLGLSLSMLFIGACVEDTTLKLAPVARFGDSQTMIGCTWDQTGWAPLPRCPYYH